VDLEGWTAPGARCAGCGCLLGGCGPPCPVRQRESTPVELGEAMAGRVLAAGGSVETIEVSQPLATAGGVAAELRSPL